MVFVRGGDPEMVTAAVDSLTIGRPRQFTCLTKGNVEGRLEQIWDDRSIYTASIKRVLNGGDLIPAVNSAF